MTFSATQSPDVDRGESGFSVLHPSVNGCFEYLHVHVKFLGSKVLFSGINLSLEKDIYNIASINIHVTK